MLKLITFILVIFYSTVAFGNSNPSIYDSINPDLTIGIREILKGNTGTGIEYIDKSISTLSNLRDKTSDIHIIDAIDSASLKLNDLRLSTKEETLSHVKGLGNYINELKYIPIPNKEPISKDSLQGEAPKKTENTIEIKISKMDIFNGLLTIGIGLIILFGFLILRKRKKNAPTSSITDIFNRHPQFGTVCLTKNGEEVKSKSEKIIANYFFDAKISYQYETPLKIPGLDKDLVPDFFLPDFGVYVEYWGGMNTIPGYNEIMAFKKNTYKQHNVPMLEIYPDNIWTEGLESKFPNLYKLESTFRYRLKRFLDEKGIEDVEMPQIIMGTQISNIGCITKNKTPV